jgi:hypothetical protein
LAFAAFAFPCVRLFCLLLNFGEAHLKEGIERIVNGLPEEKRSGLGSLLLFFGWLA